MSATPELDTTAPVPPIVKRTKKKRLASDIIGQLEDKLQENDLDIPTWLELISRIQAKNKTEDVRSTFTAFLEKFPFLTEQWITYITYELGEDKFENAEELFKKVFQQGGSSVALWTTYVAYVRRKNNMITGGEDARRTVIQAYDVAVEKAGVDPESGKLWKEYLEFIDEWNPISSFDEQQKMDLKRKIYRKALGVPLNNLEKLWAEYTAFENDLSTTTARKFINEISGSYMNARSWYREWSNLTSGLTRDLLPLMQDQTVTNSQFVKWINWINWEKLNKLEFDEKTVIDRVAFVFKQAVQSLLFKPELWFEFVAFYEANSPGYFSTQEIMDLLNIALLANPTSFSLNLKVIEFYEIDGNTTLVHKKFTSLIEQLTKIHTMQHEIVEEWKNDLFTRAAEAKTVKFQSDQEQPSDETKNLTKEEEAHIISEDSHIQSEIKKLNLMSKTITLTNVLYMRSVKRLEDTKAARGVFGNARKDKLTLTHHIFIHAALLEFYGNDPKSKELKVLELGLREGFFGNDGEYIYKYLKFLVRVNDDTNARALFESTMAKKDKIDSKWLEKIFWAFYKFEAEMFSPLGTLKKLEARYTECFPGRESLQVFADRYSFNEEESDFNLEDDLIRFNDLKLTTAESRKRKFEEGEEGHSKRLHAGETSISQLENIQLNGDPEASGEGTSAGDGKPFVTDEIYNLLRVLPNARYSEPLFNNARLISLLEGLS